MYKKINEEKEIYCYIISKYTALSLGELVSHMTYNRNKCFKR